ncbi:hypothetical protein D8674_023870 [Pyrus ussuriensis x Pyrus communis]|uniref:Uncharacterized protein n=1 Tax=Pyrus ussuriensis x Pyrus communis TaxID=2448454 RepID=A0A5N5H286_9ROSA|nr:hypothetical protein D8674_023870 [Pyrus ussuriensis x Pyrus communis]
MRLTKVIIESMLPFSALVDDKGRRHSDSSESVRPPSWGSVGRRLFCRQNFGEEKNDESGFRRAKGEGEEEQTPSPDLHSRRKKRKLASRKLISKFPICPNL